MAKIIIVGANHAGTAAANTILDNYPEHQVVLFDRNNNLSYLGCGTALWIGRQIDDPNALFYSSKEALTKKKATVHLECEVQDIDYGAKIVTARDKDGREIKETYDKLILALGSLPIQPNISGMDLENVYAVKLYQDAQKIDACLQDESVKSVAVIGAGYIGVEIAEAVRRRGKEAMLFETQDTVLSSYYDPWFSHDMDDVLKEKGVKLHFGERIEEIKGDGRVSSVRTNRGEYPADLVLMAVGFHANTAIGNGEIETFPNGTAFRVNLQQETNLPDVYAIGDCATVYSNAVQDTAYIALATNAVRSGIVAAHNACGAELHSTGVQGSNGISIYGYNMVSTGLTLRAAEAAGYEAVYTDFEDLQKPGFMKDNANVKIRIVYDKETRRILGAQMASYADISMGIHMFSLAIEEQLTIDKLKLLDIFFLPHFNQPYNYITMAALSAE